MASEQNERKGRRTQGSRGRGTDRPARRRTFFAIGEVCAMLDLKPHVLRYWETQFSELSPTKNRAGNRVYQQREVEQIALIRRLVHEERYTIEGARRRVEELKAEGCAGEQAGRALETTLLRTLRQEMQSLETLLTPPAVDRGVNAG